MKLEGPKTYLTQQYIEKIKLTNLFYTLFKPTKLTLYFPNVREVQPATFLIISFNFTTKSILYLFRLTRNSFNLGIFNYVLTSAFICIYMNGGWILWRCDENKV